jgi:hypothetical protein
MNLTQAEIMALMSAETMTEWDKVCNEIKAKRGNEYPPDWAKTIVASGIMAERKEHWTKYDHLK